MKKRIIKIIIEIIIVLSFVTGFLVINNRIHEERLNSFVYTSDGNTYAFEIEKLSFEKEDAILSGWFFELESVENKPKEVDKSKKLGLVLYNLNSEIELDIDGNEKPRKGFSFKVTRGTRTDINDYFKCEYDYSECGFTARIDKKLIDIENGEYQIILKAKDDEDPGISAAYIYKGKLQYINPQESVELQVEGTGLERIVKDGYCVVSYPEYHIFVYQYGKDLYWIADNGYSFEEDGSTDIQYQMETTQFDRLPSYKNGDDWFWSNLSDTFESYEITDKIDCGQYRVSARSIPEEYAVYRIQTGYYVEGKWIWERWFRPLVSQTMSDN